MQPIQRSAGPSQDEVELTQSIPAKFEGQLLALGDASLATDGSQRVEVSLLDEAGAQPWQSRALLRVGDVFPTRAGFLRLQQLRPGNQTTRAKAVVAHASDTGGIAPPAPTDRVLLQGGRVKFAGQWIEAVSIEGDIAHIEHWSTSQSRSKLTDAAVARQRLRVGETLALGEGVAPLRIERMQPGAGEVVGFVTFGPATP